MRFVLKHFVMRIVLDSVLADAAHMSHLAHDLVEVEAVANNEHVRHDEAAVVALVATAQGRILLTQHTRLRLRGSE